MSVTERDILAAYDLHANCYLNKPVNLDEFADLMRIVEEALRDDSISAVDHAGYAARSALWNGDLTAARVDGNDDRALAFRTERLRDRRILDRRGPHHHTLGP